MSRGDQWWRREMSAVFSGLKSPIQTTPCARIRNKPTCRLFVSVNSINAILSGYFRRFWVLEVDDEAQEESSEEDDQHLGNDSESEELDLKTQVFVNVVAEFFSSIMTSASYGLIIRFKFLHRIRAIFKCITIPAFSFVRVNLNVFDMN